MFDDREIEDFFAQSAADWDRDGVANLDEILRNSNPRGSDEAEPTAEASAAAAY